MVPRWIVPTQRTRRLAVRMLRTAKKAGGSEAVIEHYDELEAEQLLALVSVLLNRAVRDERPEPIRKHRMGAPIKPLELSDEDRARLLKRWYAGDRSPEAVLAYREYRRIHRHGEKVLKR